MRKKSALERTCGIVHICFVLTCSPAKIAYFVLVKKNVYPQIQCILDTVAIMTDFSVYSIG